jgi:hypothetical protein
MAQVLNQSSHAAFGEKGLIGVQNQVLHLSPFSNGIEALGKLRRVFLRQGVFISS